MERVEVKIIIQKDLHLYISDILCWMRGYTASKGENDEDYDFLRTACNKLKDLNRQLKTN